MQCWGGWQERGGEGRVRGIGRHAAENEPNVRIWTALHESLCDGETAGVLAHAAGRGDRDEEQTGRCGNFGSIVFGSAVVESTQGAMSLGRRSVARGGLYDRTRARI